MKVGDVGENHVQLWASQAAITANFVRRDDFGWDYCFQFASSTPASLPAGPLDLSDPHLTCMVQVKTTAVGAKRAKVAMSNWQRMVKDPLPWFFLVLTLDPEGDVASAALVHVGHDWIERVLRKLREMDPTEASRLHEHYLDLVWEEPETLSVPFAVAMRDGIRKLVGNPYEYIADKAKFRNTIGYDGRPNREITISTGLSRASEQETEVIVDFAIGLTDRLPVSAFHVLDRRFDVSRVIEDKRDLTDAFMEFSAGPPSIGKTPLTFSDHAKKSSITIPFETYTPTVLIPDLPPEQVKVRFVSPLVSFLVRPKPSGITVSWHIPGDGTRVPLSELSDAGAIMLLFANASTDNGVTVTYERKEKTLTVGYSREPTEVPAAALEVAGIAQHASFVASYFDLPVDSLVDPAQIHDQAPNLTRMRAALDPSTLDFAIGVVVDNGEQSAGKSVAIVYAMSARIGDQVVSAVVVQSGKAVWHADTGELRIGEGRSTRCLGKWTVPLSEWKDFSPKEKARTVAAEISKEYDLVLHP